MLHEWIRRVRELPIPEPDAQVLGYAALAARAAGRDLDELPRTTPLVARALEHAPLLDIDAFDDVTPERSHLALLDVGTRAARGVWYTPEPLVAHVIASVDDRIRAVWRDPLGLASARILDPAAGTGRFLVHAIRSIHRIMIDSWSAASPAERARRWRRFVRESLLDRLHGFEVLPASLAAAHVAIALALLDTGYVFRGDERIDVRAGNALDAPAPSPPVDVVVGNPPWAAHSANLDPAHREWIARYRVRARNPLQMERNLNDDYVKFVALAERRAGAGRRGAIGLVTNHSYVDGEYHAGMRRSLLASFDEVACLDLHGNRDKRERAEGGTPDENVFEGVSAGVAVIVAARLGASRRRARLRCGDLRGRADEKLAALAARTIHRLTAPARPTAPAVRFRCADPRRDEFEAWPLLSEIAPDYSAATETGFDELLLGFTRDELVDRVRRFAADPRDPLRIAARARGGNAARLAVDPSILDARELSRARPIQFRPFDRRWIWFAPRALKTHATANMSRLSAEKPGLAVTARSSERFAAMAVADLFSHKLLQSYDRALVVPLDRLPTRLVRWIVAVLHAPSYAARYERLLRTSLPRIPPPPGGSFERRMCELGDRIIAVETRAASLEPAPLDHEHTIGSHRVIASWLARRRGRTLSPDEASDLRYAASAVRALARLCAEVDATIEEHGSWKQSG